MTSNRRRKAEIRTYQAAIGVPYMEARRQTSLPTLADVMEQHPLLNDFGIGAFDPWRKSPLQRREEIAANRVELASHEDRVMEVVSWLRHNITPIKTPTFSSYGLKHLLERSPGGWYVTNGEFIRRADCWLPVQARRPEPAVRDERTGHQATRAGRPLAQRGRSSEPGRY